MLTDFVTNSVPTDWKHERWDIEFGRSVCWKQNYVTYSEFN